MPAPQSSELRDLLVALVVIAQDYFTIQVLGRRFGSKFDEELGQISISEEILLFEVALHYDSMHSYFRLLRL